MARFQPVRAKAKARAALCEEMGLDLTARELECLTLTSRGLTTQEIGEELGLSPRTAKFHVENMMRKLEAKTRAQAVSIAARSLLLTN